MGRSRLFQATQMKVAYLGTCLFLVGCSFILAPVGRADTPGFPTEPMLRLTPETYMARITNFSVDEQAQFIATGHNDKTVCLWDLQTGQLERVLRVPLAPGLLGAISAVALSPKARHVAVVATGWDGDFIYVFDGQSGRLEHRIKKDLASYVTYSPDGRYLAATTRPSRSDTGHAIVGLSVYETSRYRTMGQDIDNSGWADFDRDNRLVTIGWMGDIRLYAAGEYLSPYLTRGPPGGKESFFSATFSPDGQFIALAYNVSTRVDVVSAKTLSRAYSPNTECLGIGPAYRVDWSPDGRYLYAGKYTKSRPNTVIRWSLAGRGDITEYSLAEDESIGTLKGDRLLVIGPKHLALIDVDGKKHWLRRSQGPDFRDQEGRDGPGLALSRTGDIVEFGFQRFGKQRAWFDLRTRRLAFEPPSDASLTGPLLAAPGLAVTGWNDSSSPVLNDKPLYFWGPHVLAIAPDHKRFVVAGHSTIGVVDAATGRPLRGRIPDMPDVTWAVNITPDGRKVVAGFNDSTLRWYELRVKQLSEDEKAKRRDRTHSELAPTERRFSELLESLEDIAELPVIGSGPTKRANRTSVVADLSELLALYALPDGRWVLWTPSGYYQASPGAEELIGWHVNNGADKAPDFFPVSRFRDRFYRPDVIARVLETGNEREAVRLADLARGERTVVREVRALRPPVISILAPTAGERVTERKLTLMYEAQSTTGAITNIEARVGARSARVLQHVPDYRDNRRAVIGQITVEIPKADTVVELLAHNQNGPSESARYRVNWSGTADFIKPDLYVLAVGVSDYDGQENDLRYAAKDARDFVRAIRRQEGKIYKRVKIKLLDDRQATREAILDGLDWIERETTSRDVAVVYLAGHGVNDTQGHYRFLPADYELARYKRTTVTGAELKEFLQGVAGKTMLFFDTCYS